MSAFSAERFARVKLDNIYLPASLISENGRVECRARAAQLKAEQDVKRVLAIEEQAASRHTATERIRLWEALHGVRMPRQKDHAVLAVIAAATRLTLEQVNVEQQQRSFVLPEGPESQPE